MLRNGIAVTEVEGFADHLRTAPEAGMVTVRTRHKWYSGYTMEWDAEELTVAGEPTVRGHTGQVDMPRELGGGDRGPAPGELLHAALGACVAQQFVEHAARRGVDLEGVEVTCESRLDLRGAYQADEQVRPGLQAIRVTVRARADHADDGTLEELLRAALRTSPVADTLTRPTPIEPAVHRLPASRDRAGAAAHQDARPDGDVR